MPMNLRKSEEKFVTLTYSELKHEVGVDKTFSCDDSL